MTPLLEEALKRVATRRGRPENWLDYVDAEFRQEVYDEIDKIGNEQFRKGLGIAFAICVVVAAALRWGLL